MTFHRKRAAHRTVPKILAFLFLCLMMYSFRLLVGDQLFNDPSNNSAQCQNGFHAIWSLSISIDHNEQKVVWPEWYYQDVPARFKNAPYDMRITLSENNDFFNHSDSLIFDCDDDVGGIVLTVSILDTVENSIVNAHVVILQLEEGLPGCDDTPQNRIRRDNSNLPTSTFTVLSVVNTLITSDEENTYDGSSELKASDFLLKSMSSISHYDNYYIERADGIDDNSWEGDSSSIILNCDDLGQSNVYIWGVNDESDFVRIKSTIVVQLGQFSCRDGSLRIAESSQQDTPLVRELVTKNGFSLAPSGSRYQLDYHPVETGRGNHQSRCQVRSVPPLCH